MDSDPFVLTPMRVVRKGKTKTPSGAYKDVEADVPGSPFPARYYRKQGRNMQGRAEGAGGASDVESQQVVLFEDTDTPVEDDEGDNVGVFFVILPPGIAGRKEMRAKILRVRRYPGCLQCDVETGAE